MHQVQWIKGYGASREDVLEKFAEQVDRLGHVDNWFEWELSFSDRASVALRVPLEDPRLLKWWGDARAWERAAWAEACGQVRLGGPAPVCLAPLRASEPEDVAALESEASSEPFLERLRVRIASPEVAPPGVDPGGFAVIMEFLQTEREAALEWLEARALEGLPFLREAAPDDWPAHLVGAPRDGELHYVAVDMHV